MQNCYCGSGKLFVSCCEPYILGTQKAPSAEALMRSRYSAYCTQKADYLVATTHSSTRRHHNKKDILAWSKENNWLKLEIIAASEKTVEFKVYFMDNRLQNHIHHEKSTFKKEGDSWFYVDGIFNEDIR
jgi:SEC-C motif-containing protein